MWHFQEKNKIKIEKTNDILYSLKGELGDKEARISLAKFLRNNLAFTVDLLCGIKLAPFQEITLRAMMTRNFSMCVWGRGCGKTFMGAIFCILQCIFEPNTKIILAGPTFRTARFIFNNIEKIVDSKEGVLLSQAFDIKNKSKRNDQFEWRINGGSVTAIPLSGEKIRGFRANILVLDEFLLLPEDTVKTVLMPFLVAPQNMAERLQVREIEDKLIGQGAMEEKDRMVFENTTKMIALSSASYTFENLYKTYKDWIANIYSKESSNISYFVSQLGYEALPEDMIDKTIIEEAQSGGSSHSSFQREYCAQFTDGSDSYYSAKKMHESTIPDGESPTTLIKGNPDGKYVLAIDPSFSNSPSSDYFAMSIMELNEEKQQSALVHGYAVAGGDLRNHIEYLYYILNNFNIVFATIDNAGSQFIDSANESKFFLESNLSFFEFNSDKEGVDYDKELRRVKKEINISSGKIFYKQLFTSSWLRNANEYLQSCIDHKKVWFASRTTANEGAFNKSVSSKIDVKLTGQESLMDLIEFQDSLIYQTKKQCALIEVKSTAVGHQSFDLPQHLKRSTSPNKARKDNYTTLMLGAWATKCYFDLMNMEDIKIQQTFSPIMIH
jgi:hypothetical protein